MHLHSRIFGAGQPLVILHGLFGMSDNWFTFGRHIAAKGFHVHIPDLRNHGRSPHSPHHRYRDMGDDLLAYCKEQSIEHCHLLGHSMGGKLAMGFTLLHPEHIDKLVVVDVAPVDYRRPGNNLHRDLIDTLLAINLPAFSDRRSLQKELEQRLHHPELAAFFTKNITRRTPGGRFTWRCNLPVLRQHLDHLYRGFDDLEPYAPSPVSTLFIKGNDSDYYLPEHEPARQLFFPRSRVVGIDRAGHWVHSDQSTRFLEVTTAFLQAVDGPSSGPHPS